MVEFLNANLEKILFTPLPYFTDFRLPHCLILQISDFSTALFCRFQPSPLPYFANDIKKARRPVATRLLVY